MGVSERLLGVLSDSLVEVRVLLLGDILLAASPDGLDFVDNLPFPDLLGNSFHLDFFFRLILTIIGDLKIVIIFIDLFFFDNAILNNLITLVVVTSDLDGVLLWGIYGNLNFLVLAQVKLDGVVDEFGVFLDQVLDLLLFDELNSIILKMKSDASSATECVSSRILGKEELRVGS